MSATNSLHCLITAGALLATAPPGLAQTEVVHIANDKVGVGTTNPTQLLHVVGDSGAGGNGTAQVFVQDTTAAVGGRVLFRLDNNGIVRFDLNDNASGQKWRFANQGSFNITNVSSGVVSFKHFQNGDLTITGSLFTGAGPIPDYVFEPDYELLPLPELKKFVERERHLPNLPSGPDVAATGTINISEFQLKLLEKIEELTLYVIEQDRASRQMEARITALSNELAAVRSATDNAVRPQEAH